LTALKEKYGYYPDVVEIHRYDPNTGKVTEQVDIYRPQVFLPGK
jgi:hypothetical protein